MMLAVFNHISNYYSQLHGSAMHPRGKQGRIATFTQIFRDPYKVFNHVIRLRQWGNSSRNRKINNVVLHITHNSELYSV